MGAQGRQHVLSRYDWKVIIPIYESLWTELKTRRNLETEYSTEPYAWPSRLDPFYGFAAYPTSKIRLTSQLRLTDSNSSTAIQRFNKLIELDMVNYVMDRMASQKQLEDVLLILNSGPSSAEYIISKICNNSSEKRILFLSISWMAKLGLIKAAQ